MAAHAALIGPAADYNMFVFGIVNGNGSIEGNLAAGTTVNGVWNVAQGISGNPAQSPNPARIVAGTTVNLGGASGVGNGQNGAIYYGVSINGPIPGTVGQYYSPNLLDFSAATSLYQTLSTNLGVLTDNGQSSISASTLTLTGNSGGLNVFSVSGDNLFFDNVNINVTPGSTALINVTGNIINGAPFGQVTLNGIDAAHVIYNFENTTVINGGLKDLDGSILAPFASVNGDGTLHGQLIAEQFNGNIQLFNTAFAGSLPATIPVPATVWLFGSALAGMAGFGRMNNRRAI